MLHYQGLYMGAKGAEARKPQARAIPGTGMGVGMGGRGGRGAASGESEGAIS